MPAVVASGGVVRVPVRAVTPLVGAASGEVGEPRIVNTCALRTVMTPKLAPLAGLLLPPSRLVPSALAPARVCAVSVLLVPTSSPVIPTGLPALATSCSMLGIATPELRAATTVAPAGPPPDKASAGVLAQSTGVGTTEAMLGVVDPRRRTMDRVRMTLPAPAVDVRVAVLPPPPPPLPRPASARGALPGDVSDPPSAAGSGDVPAAVLALLAPPAPPPPPPPPVREPTVCVSASAPAGREPAGGEAGELPADCPTRPPPPALQLAPMVHGSWMMAMAFLMSTPSSSEQRPSPQQRRKPAAGRG